MPGPLAEHLPLVCTKTGASNTTLRNLLIPQVDDLQNRHPERSVLRLLARRAAEGPATPLAPAIQPRAFSYENPPHQPRISNLAISNLNR